MTPPRHPWASPTESSGNPLETMRKPPGTLQEALRKPHTESLGDLQEALRKPLGSPWGNPGESL